MYKEVKDYIETLIIGQGPEAGKPMVLYPWQRRFLRGALRQEDDAALTLARGGGKTTFIAAIAAAAVAGPLADPMAEVLIVASSFDQGLISFRHIQHFWRRNWRPTRSAGGCRTAPTAPRLPIGKREPCCECSDRTRAGCTAPRPS